MADTKSARTFKRKKDSKACGTSKRTHQESIDDTSVELFKPLFEDLFEGARYERINPFACIRIVKLRPITIGGVKRLRALFSKRYKTADNKNPDGICSLRLAFGTDTPLVVELTGDLHHLLVNR